jgi:hypothetical protein
MACRQVLSAESTSTARSALFESRYSYTWVYELVLHGLQRRSILCHSTVVHDYPTPGQLQDSIQDPIQTSADGSLALSCNVDLAASLAS